MRPATDLGPLPPQMQRLGDLRAEEARCRLSALSLHRLKQSGGPALEEAWKRQCEALRLIRDEIDAVSPDA